MLGEGASNYLEQESSADKTLIICLKIILLKMLDSLKSNCFWNTDYTPIS